jgi:hypothetical protein
MIRTADFTQCNPDSHCSVHRTRVKRKKKLTEMWCVVCVKLFKTPKVAQFYLQFILIRLISKLHFLQKPFLHKEYSPPRFKLNI